MRRVRRRCFFAAAAGSLALGAAGRAAGAAQFEYKYHHDLPVDSPMHVRVTQLWNEVARTTDGRLVVRVFPNSSLGSDTAILTEIRAGAVQLASLPAQSATGLIPALSIVSTGFAFKSEAAALAAIDGRLGEAIRREIDVKGFKTVAPPSLELGLKQLTTSARPIVNPADLNGLKIRVSPARIIVDLFRTLGATPTPVDFAQTYTALQTHLIDGTDLPVSVIEVSRYFEVQRYLSRTNHTWGGYWMVANPDAWKALSDDVQRLVERAATKYIGLERRDIAIQQSSLLDKLARQGMLVNQIDAEAFRAKLGPYYARAKAEFGSTMWSLLEDYSGGKLG